MAKGAAIITEILEKCGSVTVDPDKDRNAFLEALVHNVTAVSDDVWEELSEETQIWANDGIKRVNTNKKFPSRALRMLDPVTNAEVPLPESENSEEVVKEKKEPVKKVERTVAAKEEVVAESEDVHAVPAKKEEVVKKEAKPKESKATKSEVSKTTSNGVRVKELLADDPSLTAAQVHEILVKEGRTYALSTLAVVRTEFLQAMEVLRKKGML